MKPNSTEGETKLISRDPSLQMVQRQCQAYTHCRSTKSVSFAPACSTLWGHLSIHRGQPAFLVIKYWIKHRSKPTHKHVVYTIETAKEMALNITRPTTKHYREFLLFRRRRRHYRCHRATWPHLAITLMMFGEFRPTKTTIPLHILLWKAGPGYVDGLKIAKRQSLPAELAPQMVRIELTSVSLGPHHQRHEQH